MAALGAQTIASSYEQLLHVDTDGGGNTTTLVPIKDGDNGTTFCLQIATTSALIEGSGSKLYFSDAGGEYLSGDGTDLTITSGADILLAATANVGIGVTAPDTTLHIAHPTTTVDYYENKGLLISEAGSADGIVAFSRTDSECYIGLNKDLSSGSGYLGFGMNLDSNANKQLALWIRESGKVGIGQAAPATALHVESASNSVITWKSTDGSNTKTYHLANDATRAWIGSSDTSIIQAFTPAGLVGINTASPETIFTIDQKADDNGIRIYGYDDVSANYGEIFIDSSGYLNIDAGGDRGLELKGHGIDFWVNSGGTHIGKWTHDGKLGVGTTSPARKLEVKNTSAIDTNTRYTALFNNDVDDDDAWGIYIHGGNADQTGNTEYVSCYDHNNDKVGMIHNDSGTFSLVDISDKRLKKNIRNTDINGIDTINSIKVRDFEYKINNNTVKAQFIAQEIQEVFPQASTGTDGALTEDGKIDPMGVTKEGLVGVLVKAVQELSAKVEALENA